MTETVTPAGTGPGTEALDQARAALAAIVDQLIAASPEAARQFGRVFADGGGVGAQWIGYSLTQRAAEAQAPGAEAPGVPAAADAAAPTQEQAEMVAESLLAGLEQDLPGLAQDLGVPEEELAAALGELPDDFMAQVASTALSELG
jgi:hypothetical protein